MGGCSDGKDGRCGDGYLVIEGVVMGGKGGSENGV